VTLPFDLFYLKFDLPATRVHFNIFTKFEVSTACSDVE